MAPHRFRGIQEDSRSESSSTREKQAGVLLSGISKVRRYAAAPAGSGSNLRDVTLATASVIAQHNGQDGQGTVEKVAFERRQERLEADCASRRFTGHPSMARSSMPTSKRIA